MLGRVLILFYFVRYNFYTFGHAVRELHASRGSREGNSAFLEVRAQLTVFVFVEFQKK